MVWFLPILSSRALLELGGAELERAGVLGDVAHDLLRDTAWDVGFDLQPDSDGGAEQARQVVDHRLTEASRTYWVRSWRTRGWSSGSEPGRIRGRGYCAPRAH
jgi:hypothetical protein